MIAAGGLSGGFSAAIAGGDFWKGAAQGLITAGLNHAMHFAEKALDPPKKGGGLMFAKPTDKARVSKLTVAVIEESLEHSKNSSAVVSRTASTPEEQVDIMYNNTAKLGVESQLKIYAEAGDEVIKLYPDKEAMLNKVNENPQAVSKHLRNFELINVIDIVPKSVDNLDAFIQSLKTSPLIYNIIEPGGGEPAIHIEILQPTSTIIDD